MAAKPSQTGNRALLELNCHGVVLSPEDAAAAFALLCKGEAVKKTWSNDAPYKLETDASSMPSISVVTPAQYATLHLESDN